MQFCLPSKTSDASRLREAKESYPILHYVGILRNIYLALFQKKKNKGFCCAIVDEWSVVAMLYESRHLSINISYLSLKY